MRVDLLTREYPPEIYGGAGVHVTELVRALRASIEVQVRCFGGDRDEADTTAYRAPAELRSANAALATLATDTVMANDIAGASLAHSHTWYANAAGAIAQRLHGVPHVVTAHSLEPLRPWKAEQLGGGYRLSSLIERSAFESADAVVAVSEGMRRDILRCYPAIDPAKTHVIYNGIDLDAWQPVDDPDLLTSLGVVTGRPTVTFLGRITRQKGLPYLLKAVRRLPKNVQIVLCAGAPDTQEIMDEVTALVHVLQTERDGVVWIDRLLTTRERSTVLTASTVFVCPSVYEPLGIVNLEAMACGVAVVGTATGGIPEVVEDGVTGRLIPIEQTSDGTGTPLDPDAFVADIARTLIEVLDQPERAAEMGKAGRLRAQTQFSWNRIAETTLALYRSLIAS